MRSTVADIYNYYERVFKGLQAFEAAFSYTSYLKNNND